MLDLLLRNLRAHGSGSSVRPGTVLWQGGARSQQYGTIIVRQCAFPLPWRVAGEQRLPAPWATACRPAPTVQVPDQRRSYAGSGVGQRCEVVCVCVYSDRHTRRTLPADIVETEMGSSAGRYWWRISYSSAAP